MLPHVREAPAFDPRAELARINAAARA